MCPYVEHNVYKVVDELARGGASPGGNSPDILVLIETWLDIKLPNIHLDYGCL